MCRVALFNYAGALFIESKYGLERFFDFLEDSNGGHGNGIAVLRKGRIYIRKGITFGTDDAARLLLKQPFDWAVFHTRIASAGSVNSRNCHPFRVGDLVLAMNGTESGFKPLAEALGDLTDTEAVALVMNKFGLPAEFLAELSSVFMGFENKIPFVACGSRFGDLQLVFNADTGAIIFASEFPSSPFPKVYELERPFFWKFEGKITLPAGAKLTDNEEKRRYYYYGSYYKKYGKYGGGWWDEYDDDYDRDIPIICAEKEDIAKKDDATTKDDDDKKPNLPDTFTLNGKEYHFKKPNTDKYKSALVVYGD